MGRSAAGLIATLLLLALAPVAASGATPSAGLSCAAGPTTVGDTTLGTPCDDFIIAAPGVAAVEGGGGDDTIVAAPIAASAPCPAGCHLGVGSQTFDGGPGDDIVFGERGNDTLRGGEGNDRLFGGIGDDLLRGGPGNDRLSGGFGADSIDGDSGDDYVRGDGTIDRIFDTGGGTDTLSYSTGITPGFGGTVPYANFPPGPSGTPPVPDGERGVNLELEAGDLNGDNGIAALGGGVDEVEGQSFERVIGSPFADFIVGTDAAETIYGGGGADVILGEGGDDRLFGGADGDDLDGGAGSNLDGEAGDDNCQGAGQETSCEGTAKAVDTRDSSKVSVGLMAPGQPGPSQIYLTGSSAADGVTATYSGASVSFALSAGSFDQSDDADGGCDVTSSTQAACPLSTPLDSILLAGMGGADELVATGFPDSTGVVILGNTGSDDLSGGQSSEDVLVDGPEAGDDELNALGGDDALLHNDGDDDLLGGDGNDLFLSVSICDDEVLNGGAGRDNASWARLVGEGVDARLSDGKVGRENGGGAPECGGGSFDTMVGIEDLEGSESADVFYGDLGKNQLLGHKGPDIYFAGAGEDSILANSGDDDPTIDCGEGVDTALVDRHPKFNDAAPVGCETVREADPNSFQTVTELPPPPPPVVEPPPPAPDRKPPRTKITGRPAKVLTAVNGSRRVVFRFASSERGSSFHCKLDAKPYRLCTPPHGYKVGIGRHAVRIFAIDAAGNRDRTPALFRFHVLRKD